MGIGAKYLVTLTHLKNSGYLEGSRLVMEIGAQQLHNSFLRETKLINDLGALFGAEVPFKNPQPTESSIAHGSLEALEHSAPYSREFYQWLGFEYATIDIDGSPGSISLDLNYDTAPKNAIGKYNLVTNFGTTEHVANQLNAFKVIHDLAAHDAIMIHDLPSQGYMNHGLVNYNPKFFWMLARSNGYELLHLDFGWSAVDYALPQNIRDSISQYVNIGERPDYRTTDAGLYVVLRKAFDCPFVAPLDVPTGTKAPSPELAERYWSVFRPGAFQTRTLADRGRLWAAGAAILNSIRTRVR